jgi:lysophospholipase L1-like esterase
VDCFISGVKEGDYYGIRVKQTGAWNGLAAITTLTNSVTFYKGDVATWTSGHNTSSDFSFGYVVPVGFSMRAPMAIMIGNSITQGIPLNSAFTQVQFSTYDRTTYWGAMVADTLNWTYQNMGKGSDNMNEIRARFHEDVVNKYPRYVFIEGGINSILNGFTLDSILKDWTAVIDISIANNIVPIVSTVLPCNACTASEMNRRDSLNYFIIEHTKNKPVILINGISDSLGKFRSGGPAGNLWDFKTGYNADAYHLNATGSRVYANAILASLKNLMVNGQMSTGSINSIKVISDSLKLQNKGVLTITGNDSIKATIMLSEAGTELLLKTIYENPIIFQVNNSERSRINTNGELIINTSGTDAGDYKLQVTGNIYNTGSITTGAPSGGTNKPWKIGEAATVSPTSPNRTIRVEIDGTVYYIHAKTTND